MLQADILTWAQTYTGPKFHALLCDPPYHLTSIVDRFGKDDSAPAQYGTDGAFARASKGFMGKTWDGGDIAFRPSTWAAIAQHLYPGAWGMVFASSRGWHRLAVAIEDAGLIIQPTIFGWAYGSGFPKATNISAQIDDRAFRAWLDEHPAERDQLETLRQQARLAPKDRRVDQLRLYQNCRKANKAAAGFAPVVKTKRHQAKFDAEHYEYREKANGYNSKERDSFDVHGPATKGAADWAGHRYGGQAIKPALEPIIVFQKPYEGSPIDNITSTGAGALWIDGGRIGTDEDTSRRAVEVQGVAPFGQTMGGTGSPLGRWPANLVLTHAPECERIGTRRVKGAGWRDTDQPPPFDNHVYGQGVGKNTGAHYADADGYEMIDAWQCIPSCPVARLGAQSGESASRDGATTSALRASEYGMGTNYDKPRHDDTGTASRYFYAADWMLDRLEAADPVAYIAKASTAEREAGLDPRQTALMRLLDEDAADFEDSKAHTVYSGDRARVAHCPVHHVGRDLDVSKNDRYKCGCTIVRRAQFDPSTDQRVYSGKRYTVRRCPEHDSSIPSGSNNYSCGCQIVSGAQFDPSTVDDGRDVSIDNPYQRGETTRRNIHPTIKPISLSRYLATLLLPPAAYGPRRLLIPFAGAGSEAIGAMLAGWEEITGVELEADHVAIANARLAYWKQRAWELSDPDRKPTVVSAAAVPAGQLDMFMED